MGPLGLPQAIAPAFSYGLGPPAARLREPCRAEAAPADAPWGPGVLPAPEAAHLVRCSFDLPQNTF